MGTRTQDTAPPAAGRAATAPLLMVPRTDSPLALDGALALAAALAAAGPVDVVSPQAQVPRRDWDASIQTGPAAALNPVAPGRVRVARVVGPAAAADPAARDRLARMDMIWVPSPADRAALVAAGLPADRVRVVSEVVTEAPALGAPARPSLLWLADGSAPAEAETLLAAWDAAGRRAPGARLVVAVPCPADSSAPLATVADDLAAALARRGIDPAGVPDIDVAPWRPHDVSALVRLLADATALVVTRTGGEPARAAVLALAAGRSVIAPPGLLPEAASRQAGLIPAHAGEEALATAMDAALAAPVRPPAVPAWARPAAVAEAAHAALAAARPRWRAAATTGHPGVVIEGAVFAPHSLALVNRELARGLLRLGSVELTLSDREGAPDPERVAEHPDLRELAGRPPEHVPDLVIRQSWPPDVEVPAPGRLVAMLPWEFGPVPRMWAAAVGTRIDEVWAYTNHVRDSYLESGVDPDRVAVVPLGVDPERFHPGAPPAGLGLPDDGRFRILFCGGLIWRKGADILIDAYLRAFSPRDDVVLVLKDFGAGGPYGVQPIEERIARLARDPLAPAIHRLSGPLPDRDMPGLYTACDCLVHPFRGEGYALPVAEAMASGLAVVATGGGAVDDFATPETAVLVPSRELHVPEESLGGFAVCGTPRVREPAVDDVAEAMRRLHDDRAAARAMGARAAAWMAAEHTWDHAAAVARARIRALTGR